VPSSYFDPVLISFSSSLASSRCFYSLYPKFSHFLLSMVGTSSYSDDIHSDYSPSSTSFALGQTDASSCSFETASLVGVGFVKGQEVATGGLKGQPVAGGADGFLKGQVLVSVVTVTFPFCVCFLMNKCAKHPVGLFGSTGVGIGICYFKHRSMMSMTCFGSYGIRKPKCPMSYSIAYKHDLFFFNVSISF
jgi:hypothetical protein